MSINYNKTAYGKNLSTINSGMIKSKSTFYSSKGIGDKFRNSRLKIDKSNIKEVFSSLYENINNKLENIEKNNIPFSYLDDIKNLTNTLRSKTPNISKTTFLKEKKIPSINNNLLINTKILREKLNFNSKTGFPSKIKINDSEKYLNKIFPNIKNKKEHKQTIVFIENQKNNQESEILSNNKSNSNETGLNIKIPRSKLSTVLLIDNLKELKKKESILKDRNRNNSMAELKFIITPKSQLTNSSLSRKTISFPKQSISQFNKMKENKPGTTRNVIYFSSGRMFNKHVDNKVSLLSPTNQFNLNYINSNKDDVEESISNSMNSEESYDSNLHSVYNHKEDPEKETELLNNLLKLKKIKKHKEIYYKKPLELKKYYNYNYSLLDFKYNIKVTKEPYMLNKDYLSLIKIQKESCIIDSINVCEAKKKFLEEYRTYITKASLLSLGKNKIFEEIYNSS